MSQDDQNRREGDGWRLSKDHERVVAVLKEELRGAVAPLHDRMDSLHEQTVTGFAETRTDLKALQTSIADNWQRTHENRSLIDRLEERVENIGRRIDKLADKISAAARHGLEGTAKKASGFLDVSLTADHIKYALWVLLLIAAGWAATRGVDVKEVIEP